MDNLDDVAETVLEARYLQQDEAGNVVETPAELFERVAHDLSRAESQWGGDPDAVEERFHDALSSLEFLPNSPTLMNAGTELQQLAACFVLPVPDSIDGIFSALKSTALIHQSGGGTGFTFGDVRPSGDVVMKTGGVASGPVSFMRIFDAATEQIKQGGRRRGANMGILPAHHPDVDEFVTAKEEEGTLRNFNVSVATDEAFWDAYEADEQYPLINPRTGEAVDAVDPEAVLDACARMAWGVGDPGVLFLDRINAENPTPEVGRIRATNPCGETPLLPYEACVLGSVNLSKMTDGDAVDWDKLDRTVRTGIRLLDNAITRSDFPLEAIEVRMAANRKVGLGVMGFHDALVDLEIPYDSEKAVDFADELMAFISESARDASRELANEREPFPNWEESIHDEPVRNATTTSIAPTGTISLIAGCSASIEPVYGVAYEKHVLGGLDQVNDRFVDVAKERGFYSEELMDRVRGEDSIQDVEEIPEDVRELFHTAHDVPPARHVEIQAAFQEHVDNAVSKTVNMSHDADVADVRDVFELARDLGVKGITVFRSGSRREQILGEDPLKEQCASECDWVPLEAEMDGGSNGSNAESD
ncbi:adenosylcobalamin-dependent ribonucleoside-diphosphate reductase [Haloparvum sp. AD34]